MASENEQCNLNTLQMDLIYKDKEILILKTLEEIKKIIILIMIFILIKILKLM